MWNNKTALVCVKSFTKNTIVQIPKVPEIRMWPSTFWKAITHVVRVEQHDSLSMQFHSLQLNFVQNFRLCFFYRPNFVYDSISFVDQEKTTDKKWYQTMWVRERFKKKYKH